MLIFFGLFFYCVDSSTANSLRVLSPAGVLLDLFPSTLGSQYQNSVADSLATTSRLLEMDAFDLTED